MRYPGRYVKESENHLPSQAATNIIIDSRVKTHFYTIVEALDLLRYPGASIIEWIKFMKVEYKLLQYFAFVRSSSN